MVAESHHRCLNEISKEFCCTGRNPGTYKSLKPFENNEPRRVKNTSKAITSTFKAISLVSVQEVLAKCNFLTTPATAQQCFVLSGHWMWHCVCVPVCTCNTGQSRVSCSIIDSHAEREWAWHSAASTTIPAQTDFQTTKTERRKRWQWWRRCKKPWNSSWLVLMAWAVDMVNYFSPSHWHWSTSLLL